MPRSVTFGSPIVKDLERKFGAVQTTYTEEVKMKKTADVSHFLKEKREQEKRALKSTFRFK